MNILSRILRVIALIAGTIATYLAVIIFLPWFPKHTRPMPRHTRKDDEEDTPYEAVSFTVEGIPVRGRFYHAKTGEASAPCLVMCHGLGGTQDMLLPRYARRFTAEGICVLTFDYRHFGESGGEPRQCYSQRAQLDDLRAAIAYARSRADVKGKRVALWGTSAGGGYGLIIAAEDPDVACIIGQCPALDRKEDGKKALAREGVGAFLRLIPHAQRDKGRGRFGLSAHTIPLAGKEGDVALLTAPNAYEGYARLQSGGFKNEICARILLTHEGENPIEAAMDVATPTLLAVCEHDELASDLSHVKAAIALGRYANVKVYPIGHFDIYEGRHFKTAVADQITFLREHLFAEA